MGLFDRIKRGWNAFKDDEEQPVIPFRYSEGSSYRPDKLRTFVANERTTIASIISRIAVDASLITINHVQLDNNGRFKEIINSGLNRCFNLSANLDQPGRAFIEDAVLSMLQEGVVALVPIETDPKPMSPGSYDILSMRTGKVVEWYPDRVKVNVYDELCGKRKDIILPKWRVAIVENPFYSIMNESNSTLQRLTRKLSLLDIIDEQSSSGKLDLIIQLPYVIKSDLRKKQAEERRKDITDQLANSKYGIAYTDGTEKITQLNRPVENNLMSQVEYLTNLMFSQLGITQKILDGTASSEVMTNYYSRIIEPIVSIIVDEVNRKFITDTGRTQGKSITFFRDPFKLVPIDKIATMADTFTRNEIMSSNEIRQVIGLKPSSDPSADQLRNKNLNASESGPVATVDGANTESSSKQITAEDVKSMIDSM